jgi:photosystem II stability/assembly factor-like uncharacterized protein
MKNILRLIALSGWLGILDPAIAEDSLKAGATDDDWTGVASSANGHRLVAVANSGAIYISRNSGRTWSVPNVPAENWSATASSADGENLVAVASSGGICTSANGGVTWILNDSFNPGWFWVSVTSSSDGSKLAAVNYWDSLAYTSTNFGMTWFSNSIPNVADSESFGLSRSIAGSADGTKLVVATLTGTIFTSTNSGIDWIATTTPIANWSSVASSADGGKLVAADALGGGIYVSTNFGTDWTLTSAPSNIWYSVASSANGKKLVAVAGGNSLSPGPVYISSDSGRTWDRDAAPRATWYSVAASADGDHIVAGVLGGPVYVGHPAKLHSSFFQFNQ